MRQMILTQFSQQLTPHLLSSSIETVIRFSPREGIEQVFDFVLWTISEDKLKHLIHPNVDMPPVTICCEETNR
jgi:hypothetical protein